ncbi:MAG: amidohydrolase [Clostridiales bacterium]|jgi:5-methylthioadenosine/S-adenosylhomocysteine deaminase|nr:amidohydrolase [Clostridiales bacterium]
MNLLIKGIDVVPSADAPVLRGADIGIAGDRILFVRQDAGGGSGGEAPPPRDFRPDRVLDGSGRLAIPGLVNAHCHAAMTLLRGYADDLELETWLYEKIFPAEARMSDEDIYWGTTLGVAEMLRGGVTCFNDMYLKMENVASAIRDAGIRAAVSIGPLLTEKRGDALVDTEGCKAFFKRWGGAAEGRLRVNMEIHSVFLYQPETLIAGARLAKELGAAIHIHLLETATERRNMLEQRGKSSVFLAAGYGLLDVPVIAAHCVHADDDEIALLREKHVSVAHNPSSNLKLASGVAPITKMLKSGVNVCLGTDGAASNNTLDLFREMRLAALLHKGISGEPTAVTAAEAFRMATRNGAEALGFSETGGIEPGKKADLAILSLDKPHLTPIYDHLSALVYAARASDVETVIVDGKVLMENGALTTIDEEKAKYMVARYAQKNMN